MVGTTSNWEDELRGWLKPFLDRLGHKSRRRMCPLYVAGLIGPGDRKSVQPLMAMIAYAFLQHRRLKKVRRGKKNQRPAPSTDVAGGSPRHRRPHHAIKSSAMSVLPILDQRGKAA